MAHVRRYIKNVFQKCPYAPKKWKRQDASCNAMQCNGIMIRHILPMVMFVTLLPLCCFITWYVELFFVGHCNGVEFERCYYLSLFILLLWRRLLDRVQWISFLFLSMSFKRFSWDQGRTGQCQCCGHCHFMDVQRKSS
jgi:hypothetical protein